MNKNFTLVLTLLALVLFNETASAAAAAGGGLAWDGYFTKITNSITGPMAYAVAVLSIFGAGCMLAFGGNEMNAFLRSIIFIFLAIAFIVAAKAILQSVTGVGAEIPLAYLSSVSLC